jgi:hypothetical protein
LKIRQVVSTHLFSRYERFCADGEMMRRLLLFAVLVPAACWLFWASCESDDYRTTLPLRSFDAAPREGGSPTGMPDLSRPDQAQPDQSQADLPAGDAGGGGDGGVSDAATGGG